MFDLGPYFLKLIDWFIDGNYEVSREVLHALEEMESDLTRADVERAEEKVRAALKRENSEDKQTGLELLLDLLSETREDIK